MTNWDNEIDDVARAMTEGEPHGSLKAWVLARIEDQPRPLLRSPWVVAPIATVAIAMVAVFVMREPGEVRLPSTQLGPGKPATAEAPVAVSRPVAPAVAVPTTRRTSVQTVRVAAETETADIDSLAPPPLVIDPIDVDGMENMESLQVLALSVARLEVPAIGE